MKLNEDTMEKFIEEVIGEGVKEMDYESSWTIFNGLVVSYLKAKGEYSKYKEDLLKESLRKVILSLPKYDFGYKGEYKLNEEDKQYFSICPNELTEGLSYKDLNEKTISDVAEKVLDFSAEKGVRESGNVDRLQEVVDNKKKLSEVSMAEFVEVNKQVKNILEKVSSLANGVEQVKLYYKQQAEKAVENEIDYQVMKSNYLIAHYSSIMLASEDVASL